MGNDHNNASRRYWDAAARENAVWYVANKYKVENRAFFDQGAAETDWYLDHFDVRLTATAVVLEIGSGVGRMTGRLAQLASHVIAADVSHEMLKRCRTNCATLRNVEYLLLPGDGTLPGVKSESLDLVFSYITLQHVPTKTAQLRYLREACRVLTPGGHMLIQVRSDGPRARVLDWAGHFRHIVEGRRTLASAWRGARLSTTQILQAVDDPIIQADVRTFNGRHRWVVAKRVA